MEPFEYQSGETLTVNPEIKNYLSEAAKWARFLGIVGYIFIGLLVVGGLFAGTFMNSIGRNAMAQNNNNPMASGFFPVLMGAYFIIIALIYYFPTRYLHQFGVKTRNALNHDEQFDFTEAFSRLKSFFKFFGIFTAIFLALYGVGLLVMVLFGTFR